MTPRRVHIRRAPGQPPQLCSPPACALPPAAVGRDGGVNDPRATGCRPGRHQSVHLLDHGRQGTPFSPSPHPRPSGNIDTGAGAEQLWVMDPAFKATPTTSATTSNHWCQGRLGMYISTTPKPINDWVAEL